jgi:hypothetical protein
MSTLPKRLSILVATALLALGLAACGGSGDSNSTTDPGAAVTTSTQKEGGATTTAGGASKNATSDAKSGSSDSEGAKEASEFVPKPHSDSGGGAKPFVVKGGDNSIQEYGAEASGSEFEQAATTLHNFLDARAEGNWAATCSYMSQDSIKSFEALATHTKGSKGCPEILGTLINPDAMGEMRTEAAQVDVVSLRVEGKQAFLIYTGPKGTVIAMGMTPEGGTWKVASLSGTPLN